jgi:L-iditol 2-dehydrogenase
MKAVVYRGVDNLVVESIPVPRMGPQELLVRIGACGVCPTDIKKIKHGTVEPPRVFGHESAGIIAKKGALVRGFEVGDRVALHHHVPCMDCHACRHGVYAQCATYQKTGITAGFAPAGGGYAEYVRVMPFVFPGIVRIPDKNSLIEGAFLEPVNTVLKAIHRLNLLPGDKVMVAGQGPIGLMFTRLLSARGMSVLATDLLPERLKLAKTFGATLALPGDQEGFADRLERWSRGQKLDAMILAVPVNGLATAGQTWVRGGGQVLLFAHTLRKDWGKVDLGAICMEEKDLIGSYSSDVTLQKEVAKIVFSRVLDVRKLVTHRFSLDQAAAAVNLAANPQSGALKIVVDQCLEKD